MYGVFSSISRDVLDLFEIGWYLAILKRLGQIDGAGREWAMVITPESMP